MTSRLQKISLFLGRVIAGLYFVNFGLAALWTPQWSPISLVSNAHTFNAFYHGLAGSAAFPFVAPVIEFGFLVIGACLVIGLFSRIAAVVALAVMLFLYFPTLAFPYVCSAGTCSAYIVNEYLLMAGLLFILLAFRANEDFSIGHLFHFS